MALPATQVGGVRWHCFWVIMVMLRFLLMAWKIQTPFIEEIRASKKLLRTPKYLLERVGELTGILLFLSTTNTKWKALGNSPKKWGFQISQLKGQGVLAVKFENPISLENC